MIHISIFSLLTNRRSKTTSICLDSPNHVILGTGIYALSYLPLYTRVEGTSRAINAAIRSLNLCEEIVGEERSAVFSHPLVAQKRRRGEARIFGILA